MGHYAAEMMCDRCGNLRCTCPPPPKKPNGNFIVGDGFSVLTVDEFDADPKNRAHVTKYGPIPMNPVMYRHGKKEFKKRQDAEAYARELCEAAVERTRTQLASLKKTLKVERPWEKK